MAMMIGPPMGRMNVETRGDARTADGWPRGLQHAAPWAQDSAGPRGCGGLGERGSVKAQVGDYAPEDLVQAS